MKNKEIAGIIYPIPFGDLDKIKDIPKQFIFVKFQARESLPTVTSEAKFFLYVSHSRKEIIGQGIIRSLELMRISEVIKKYEPLLLMPAKRVFDYARGREDRRVLVLNISNFSKFYEPLMPKFNVTMAGKLLSKLEVTKLVRLL